jgi:hypothetical protein
MGLVDKTLLKLGHFADKSRGETFFTRPGKGIKNSEFVPRVLKAPGVLAVTGIALGGMLVSDMLRGYGETRTGPVTYAEGHSKMTGPFTTGAVSAMKRAAKDDPEIFNELAEDAVKSGGIFSLSHHLDDHGANPAFIKSFYNMG